MQLISAWSNIVFVVWLMILNDVKTGYVSFLWCEQTTTTTMRRTSCSFYRPPRRGRGFLREERAARAWELAGEIDKSRSDESEEVKSCWTRGAQGVPKEWHAYTTCLCRCSKRHEWGFFVRHVVTYVCLCFVCPFSSVPRRLVRRSDLEILDKKWSSPLSFSI